MPRIRTVKPDLWHDEAIGEISLGARLTFIGLITQADDQGRQKGDPRLIRSLLFPYDDFTIPEVSGWLAELSGAGLIDHYKVGGKDFIELPTWNSHQRISHATDSALPSASEADSAGPPEDSGAAPEDSGLKGKEGIGREEEGNGIESTVSTDDAALSHLLADLIAANDPDGKRPKVTQAWAVEERRLQEIDKRSPQQIEFVIRWVQADHFESNVVLSMPKLRKRYDQLVRKAFQKQPSRANGSAISRTDQDVADLMALQKRLESEEAA